MQLDAFQHGTGRVADLVAVIAFLVAAHPAMRAEIGALVEKLRTMMRRHERRRTGGGGGGQRRRKEKQPGKRATARAAAQEASAATGLADSCIAQVGEWTEAGVKRLLVGRTVVLLASEYGDADDGTSAAADDDADEETFKAVVTSVESDAAGVVFVWAKHADASTERMTAADAVAHIEPLNALPLERLAAMPKRLLVAECRARGLPHSNKVQQKLAELLTAEFARLRDALPEDEAEEGEEPAGGGGGGGGGGEEMADDGDDDGSPAGGEPAGEGAPLDDAASLEAALKHAAEHANQQQLIAIEKLFAKVAAAAAGYRRLTELLLSAGWPLDSPPPAAQPPPPPAPAPPVQPATPAPGAPAAPVPPTAPAGDAETTAVALARLVDSLPHLSFAASAPPSFEAQLAQRAEPAMFALHVKSSLTSGAPLCDSNPRVRLPPFHMHTPAADAAAAAAAAAAPLTKSRHTPACFSPLTQRREPIACTPLIEPTLQGGTLSDP